MRNHNERRWIILMLVVSLALSFSVAFPLATGYAKSAQSIQKDINKTKKDLQKSKENEERLNDKIDNLNREIKDTEVELNHVKVEVQEANREYLAQQYKLDRQKAKLDEGNEKLNARLRKMYKNGGIGFMDVILSSENVTSLVFNVEMVQKIYENDKNLIMILKKHYNELKSVRDDLKKAAEELNDKEVELAALQDELESDNQKLSNALATAEQNTADLSERLAQLEREAAAVSRAVQNAPADIQQSVSQYRSNGQLAWPIPGCYTITSGFGNRIHPMYGGGDMHMGIDIAGPAGTAIVAADDGVVLEAGFTPSYGNKVVIMHGNGISTLYAHCSSLVVGYGQHVKRGQTIARCGSTGDSTGPHLHFEVRVNGNLCNPRGFI